MLFRSQGNLCSAGIVRLGEHHREGARQFDGKVYPAVYYLGVRELQADLAQPDGVLERLKAKVSHDDLYYTWLANWKNTAAQNGAIAELRQWNKVRLWDYLLAERLLRVMVVVAGAGPHAAGMPEIDLSVAAPTPLDAIAVLATDGRVCFGNGGVSIARSRGHPRLVSHP